MSEWTENAPLVTDGEAVDANSVNKSTLVLSERTAILKALIDSISAGQQLVLRNVPVSQDVFAGHVVYFNDDDALTKKALARWEDLGTGYTANRPADSAVYTGVVTAKPTADLADILISGMGVLDLAAQDRLFDNATPESGVYFLSNSVEGSVAPTKPAMSVRVLEYQTDGIIRVFPPAHEPITHTHLDYILLSGDWLAAGSFTDPPAGATFGYDFTTANSITINLAEAILPGVGDGTFIGRTDGAHHFEGEIFKDETGIWWTGAAPAQDYDLHVLSADVKDMAVLHTILTQTLQALNVVNSNGRVVVDFKQYGTEDVVVADKAVVGINFDDHVLQLGKIVNKILAGAGMTITATGDDGNGTVTIASSLYNNMPIPAQIINLNNAVTSVEGAHVITEFPTGRLSQVACSCVLPNMEDGTYIARIWIQGISPVANQPAPDCEFSLLGTPVAAGVNPGALTPSALPAFPAIVNAGDVYYIESAVDIVVSAASRGQINYTLELDSPADPLKMISTGIILIQQ